MTTIDNSVFCRHSIYLIIKVILTLEVLYTIGKWLMNMCFFYFLSFLSILSTLLENFGRKINGFRIRVINFTFVNFQYISENLDVNNGTYSD